MRSLLYFLPLFKTLTGPLLLSLGLSLVTLAAGIGLLGVSGWFLTAAALTTAGAAFNLFAPSAGVRGLSFLRILSRYGERLTGHNATLKLLSELRRWLFARLFGLVPVGGRFGRADLVSRLVADIDALDTMFLLALGPITTAAVVGIVMSALLAVVLPGAAIAYAFGFGSAVLLVPAMLIALSRAPSAEANAASADLRRAILDGIDGHRDLVLFGAVAAIEASADDAALRLAGAKRRVALLGSLATAAVQLLAGAILVATLLAGLEALGAGRIEGPVLAGLLLAVVASFEASAVLVRSATRLAGSAAAAERLVAVAETEPAVADPAVPSDLPPGGDVEFAGVTFGYEPSRPVLRNLGFTVATGE
ncbi:MAG: thiol reductant ABC exporter subunit CydC, partial [Devosia sp.]|nr:thiol reductant ABC exporter subunit CydC [Devosia sp.]